MDNVVAVATTEVVPEETFTFVWHLKNFLPACNADTPDPAVQSPIFTGGPRGGHKWRLKIDPNSKEDEESEGDPQYISLFLHFMGFAEGDEEEDPKFDRHISADFELTLSNSKGHIFYRSPRAVPESWDEGQSFGWDQLMLTSNLKTHISPVGYLKIVCKVTVGNFYSHTITKSGDDDENMDPASILKRRQSELLHAVTGLTDDPELKDIAISTSTKTFMAHKLILVARSSVFRAMLTTPMLESARNSIDITDFDEVIVKGMLDYIYTGVCEGVKENPDELLQIADKYDLAGLKEDCEREIAKKLTVTNTAELLALANLYNAKTLKRKAGEYFSRNSAAVKKTKAYQDLVKSYPAVVKNL